ncbi:hypothetical protein BD560DRAFT_493909 [Blakeslea trispora]|nr:hypothetical protein BD560DRAFT_493909 [Blakeslea trispora]
MIHTSSIAFSLATITALAYTSNAVTTCTVGTGGIVSTNMASTFKEYKDGGTVVFFKGAVYHLDDMVAVSGLKGSNVQFHGTLNLSVYHPEYYNQKCLLFYCRARTLPLMVPMWVSSMVMDKPWYDATKKKKGGYTDTISSIYALKSSSFSDLTLNNVDNRIVAITQYCDIAQLKLCDGDNESSPSVKGVEFKSITSSVSSLGKPIVSIDCSKNSPCSEFTLNNIYIAILNLMFTIISSVPMPLRIANKLMSF